MNHQRVQQIISLEQLNSCLEACQPKAISEIEPSRDFYKIQGREFRYPNGTIQWREWIKKKPATVVVPEDSDGNLFMVIQPTGAPETISSMIEFPAGYAEADDEDAKATGIREMLEETGLAVNPDSITDLGIHYQDPGAIRQPVHVYLAEECFPHRKPKPDGGEYIKLYRVSKSMLMEMLFGGYIYDANTYIAGIKALIELGRIEVE